MPRFHTALAFLCFFLVPWTRTEAQQILWAVGDGRDDQSSDLYQIENYANCQGSSNCPRAKVIGETGLILTDVAAEPRTGRLFAIDWIVSGQDSTRLHELDPSTGEATLIGSLGTRNQAALEFDALGRLWSWGDGVYTDLSQIDPSTGAVLATHPMDFPATGDLAYDGDGRMYGTIGSWLVTLDAPFGGQNDLHQPTFQDGFHGLEIDTHGNMYALKDASHYPSRASLWSIDQDTGACHEIGEIQGAMELGARGLTFSGTGGVRPHGGGLGLPLPRLGRGDDSRSHALVTGLENSKGSMGWFRVPSSLQAVFRLLRSPSRHGLR